MPGIIPFTIIGTVLRVHPETNIAYAKVNNGNVYYLYPSTPGVDFSRLRVGQQVELEVTYELSRVYKARILE